MELAAGRNFRRRSARWRIDYTQQCSFHLSARVTRKNFYVTAYQPVAEIDFHREPLG
jgi:hypothetical protein